MMPDLCTTFGCGNRLTSFEKLCGSLCTTCSSGKQIVSYVGKRKKKPLSHTEFEQQKPVRKCTREGKIIPYPVSAFIQKLYHDDEI